MPARLQQPPLRPARLVFSRRPATLGNGAARGFSPPCRPPAQPCGGGAARRL